MGGWVLGSQFYHAKESGNDLEGNWKLEESVSNLHFRKIGSTENYKYGSTGDLKINTGCIV